MQFKPAVTVLVGLLLLQLTFVAPAEKIWPKEYPNCHRYDPKISECLLKATEQIRPIIIRGAPELGLPSIDPFTVPEIVLQQGTQALNFKAQLTNVKLTGLKNYKFSQFIGRPLIPEWDTKLSVSPIKVEGDYKVTGRILIVPIQGNGKFVANADRLDIHFYQTATLRKKNGVDFVTPVNTTSTIDAKGIKVKLDGLFGRSGDFDNVANQVIKDNIDVLFEDLKPTIEKVVSQLMEGILVKSFEDSFPYDVLYPPIP